MDRAAPPCVWKGSWSAQRDIGGRLGQVLAKAALIELRDQTPLELVAFVEEAELKGNAEVTEDFGVLRPGDDRARAHHRGKVAIDEGVSGKVRDPDHVAHRPP